MSDLRARAAVAAGREVAPQDGPRTIGALIQANRGEIQRALPRNMDADRFARITLTVVRRTKDLDKCTPESFLGALLTCSQLGLEPGPLGEAYLVPYEDRRKGIHEAQLLIGYQGYAKLFLQHPSARSLSAEVVYAADEFEWELGSSPFIRHKPSLATDRGPVRAYYAVASLMSGATPFVVLSPDDVKRLRGKEGPNGGIKDPMRWMEKKSCVRQLMKLLPKDPNLIRAITQDETIRRDLAESAIDDPGPVVGYVVSKSTGEVLSAPTPVNIIDAESVDEAPADDGGGYSQGWGPEPGAADPAPQRPAEPAPAADPAPPAEPEPFVPPAGPDPEAEARKFAAFDARAQWIREAKSDTDLDALQDQFKSEGLLSRPVAGRDKTLGQLVTRRRVELAQVAPDPFADAPPVGSAPDPDGPTP